MPWQVSDVEKHKKGLTPSQKKEWVKIANGVYNDCMKNKGSDKTCAPKAIRIANSKFSMSEDVKMKKMEVPQGALRLTQPDCLAHVEFAQEGEEKKPKLNMLAYSGKIIKNHFWWGDLAIDISGLKFEKKKYPILEDHQNDKKIAFSKGPPSVENMEVRFNPDKVTFVDSEESKKFQKLSSQGFPYESSMYVTPMVIERLEDGASAEVNGFTMKGPGTVFRKAIFNEASVCVFGYDHHTEASAFSKDKTELSVEEISNIQVHNINNGEEVKIMDLAQLKKDHPDLVEQIRTEVKTEVKTELTKEFDGQKTSFSNEIKGLQAELSKRDEKILALEKKEAIRAENELQAMASQIWTEKLSKSNVPDHLYDKVRKHVTHGKFVKDGILDATAFGKAIDDEIADWEKRGVTKVGVLGTGFSVRTDVDSQTALQRKAADENKAATEGLLALVGQKKTTT